MRHITVLILLVLLFGCSERKAVFVFNEGFIYGTVYHITYSSPNGEDYQDAISNELNRLNQSFSTFVPNSIISKVNKNEEVELDSLFINVYNRSVDVWKNSGGAFDPTVMPLVNAWGFGFKHKENVSQAMIDSLLQFVGMQKTSIEKNTLVKEDPRTMLDFSAIAKGYTVDVIGLLLQKKGCENYMVEIGGEVTTHGKNPKGKMWKIGINEPNEDEPAVPNEFQAILELTNKAIATSGNYRNFYVEDGKKYAHTIDPATGYPVQHSLLSATVLANDCMTADAYATAFMVLGTEKARALAENLTEVEAFLIYADENGKHAVLSTKGFSAFIAKE